MHVAVQHSALVHGRIRVEHGEGDGTACLVVAVGHREVDRVAGHLGEHEGAARR